MDTEKNLAKPAAAERVETLMVLAAALASEVIECAAGRIQAYVPSENVARMVVERLDALELLEGMAEHPDADRILAGLDGQKVLPDAALALGDAVARMAWQRLATRHTPIAEQISGLRDDLRDAATVAAFRHADRSSAAIEAAAARLVDEGRFSVSRPHLAMHLISEGDAAAAAALLAVLSGGPLDKSAAHLLSGDAGRIRFIVSDCAGLHPSLATAATAMIGLFATGGWPATPGERAAMREAAADAIAELAGNSPDPVLDALVASLVRQPVSGTGEWDESLSCGPGCSH